MSSEDTHKGLIAIAADVFPHHNPSSDTVHILTSFFFHYAPNHLRFTTLMWPPSLTTLRDSDHYSTFTFLSDYFVLDASTVD